MSPENGGTGPLGDDLRDLAYVEEVKDRRAASLSGNVKRARALDTSSATRREEGSREHALDIGQHIVVRVGSERYGIPVADVESIQPVPALTPIPGVPPFVAGVISIVGRAISVIDLGRLVGVTPSKDAANERVVLVQVGDETVGVRVDEVERIHKLDDVRSFIRAEALSSWLTPAQITGVADGSILLLDLGLILRDPRVLVDQEPWEKP